jgi:hypothetical protein
LSTYISQSKKPIYFRLEERTATFDVSTAMLLRVQISWLFLAQYPGYTFPMLGRNCIPSAIKTKAACTFETSGMNSDMLRKIQETLKPREENCLTDEN